MVPVPSKLSESKTSVFGQRVLRSSAKAASISSIDKSDSQATSASAKINNDWIKFEPKILLCNPGTAIKQGIYATSNKAIEIRSENSHSWRKVEEGVETFVPPSSTEPINADQVVYQVKDDPRLIELPIVGAQNFLKFTRKWMSATYEELTLEVFKEYFFVYELPGQWTMKVHECPSGTDFGDVLDGRFHLSAVGRYVFVVNHRGRAKSSFGKLKNCIQPAWYMSLTDSFAYVKKDFPVGLLSAQTKNRLPPREDYVSVETQPAAAKPSKSDDDVIILGVQPKVVDRRVAARRRPSVHRSRSPRENLRRRPATSPRRRPTPQAPALSNVEAFLQGISGADIPQMRSALRNLTPVRGRDHNGEIIRMGIIQWYPEEMQEAMDTLGALVDQAFDYMTK